MKAQHLGPSHPCLGCPHRGKVFTVEARKNMAGHLCLHKSGRETPICWGDALPDWCPVKAVAK